MTYRVPSMAEIREIPPCGFDAVSTFSGCGGSSLGYRIAGFRVLWANEFIPAARETYNANRAPYTMVDGRDIRAVKPDEILAAIGKREGELDLFDGSPPCSSFSTAGSREDGWGKEKKYSDSKQRTDDLFFEFARLVKGVMPKVFVAENVKGLTMGAAAGLLGEPQMDFFKEQDDTIYHTLCDIGYRVEFRVLNAADFGVPQSRNRCIFVGVRNDLGVRPVYPDPVRPRYRLADALPFLGQQPIPGVQRFVDGATGGEVTNDACMERFAVGREWEKIGGFGQSEKFFQLVRPDPDKPCPTITATTGSVGAAGVCHPLEKRKFSVPEMRRICSFPDDFALTGTYKQQIERMGRAVPPVFMSYIAAAIRDGILAPLRRASEEPVLPL